MVPSLQEGRNRKSSQTSQAAPSGAGGTALKVLVGIWTWWHDWECWRFTANAVPAVTPLLMSAEPTDLSATHPFKPGPVTFWPVEPGGPEGP